MNYNNRKYYIAKYKSALTSFKNRRSLRILIKLRPCEFQAGELLGRSINFIVDKIFLKVGDSNVLLRGSEYSWKRLNRQID